MNHDAFVAKWNNEQVTAYGGECVALVAQYCIENGKPIAYANAKDWWGHPALTGAFDFVLNDPNDLKQVPPRGAIMIWKGELAGSGNYGHIAIFDGIVSPGVFRSFDQNWGGRQAHMVNHNWNNVKGWMVPKSVAPPAPQGGDEMIATTDEADKMYKMLRPNGGATAAEIAGTAGKRTYKQFVIDGQAEVRNRDQAQRDQAAQLGNMQASINQLNQTITAVTADNSATKAQMQEALVKAAELTSELETSHDTITDLQKQLETAQNNPVDEKEVVTNWLRRIWESLFKK